MKTFTTVTLVSGVIGLAATALSSSALSAPGKGWDTFHTGQGDPIPVASSGTAPASQGGSAGKGWDTFHSGQGDAIPAASGGRAPASSSTSAGKGWDTFHTGQGEPIPGAGADGVVGFRQP